MRRLAAIIPAAPMVSHVGWVTLLVVKRVNQVRARIGCVCSSVLMPRFLVVRLAWRNSMSAVPPAAPRPSMRSMWWVGMVSGFVRRASGVRRVRWVRLPATEMMRTQASLFGFVVGVCWCSCFPSLNLYASQDVSIMDPVARVSPVGRCHHLLWVVRWWVWDRITSAAPAAAVVIVAQLWVVRGW